MRPFDRGHHYLHYLHHSLASGQITGTEHSPALQQKIGLKIYWAWPCPSEQDLVFPTVSLSHQEASISLLSLSVRGQTEWKPQSQKTSVYSGIQFATILLNIFCVYVHQWYWPILLFLWYPCLVLSGWGWPHRTCCVECSILCNFWKGFRRISINCYSKCLIKFTYNLSGPGLFFVENF